MPGAARVRLTDRPEARARVLELAAPRHVATVREVVLDRLTPEEIRVLGDIAGHVLGGLAQEP